MTRRSLFKTLLGCAVAPVVDAVVPSRILSDDEMLKIIISHDMERAIRDLETLQARVGKAVVDGLKSHRAKDLLLQNFKHGLQCPPSQS